MELLKREELWARRRKLQERLACAAVHGHGHGQGHRVLATRP